MFRCLSWLPAYSVVAPSRPRRRPPYGRSGDERGWVSGPLQLIFGNSSRPHSSSWVSVTPPAHLWLTDCIVFVSSLIYTLICVSTIGFVNISFKIIKESQLVYFKFLNMIYCCFSQSLSVADLEPVRSGVFFYRPILESGLRMWKHSRPWWGTLKVLVTNENGSGLDLCLLLDPC